MRILSSELKNRVGQSVTVAGWLHKKRSMGGLMFVVLRDRDGLLQAVVQDAAEQDKLRGLQVGTVLAIKGMVKAEPRVAAGAELHDPEMTVQVPVTAEPLIEIDKPIDHKSDNLDTLLDHRVINVRNVTEGNIFRLRAALHHHLREFLHKEQFTEIHTPKLLAEPTEGGAEVFKVEYFDQSAVLAQSPQFYKQIMVGAYERVFEIGPAFRAEPSMTTRHTSEVSMLDIELGFIDSHNDVLDMVQAMTYHALTKLYKEQSELLDSLKAPELLLKPEFPRYTVAEVHQFFTDATGQDTTREKDLIPAEERWICDYASKEHGCEAVFVTEFPVKAMKFYHMVNPENDQTVLWADLLFRGVEVATCPQREHRYDKLVAQMKSAGLDPKHPGYKYYLQAFEFGLPPHGGCGFGPDRLLQKVIGLGSVKEATLFPRDMNRLTP